MTASQVTASSSPPPATGGSFASELPKSYTPATAEVQVRQRWEDANAFHASPNDQGEPYCILIPPPNVTAALHLGHAFNNTLQDVLTRFHRMRGDNTLWMPGTDHAGIATQAVVEKRLLLQNKRRTDFTREEFVTKVQEWKDEYEATIIEQLKVMGCSCDYDRTRFTMDEVCAKAVREAFFRLFKDGLIYRGKRLVNWDPVTQTALADDEVEMEEVQGAMYYLRYPVVSDGATKRRSDVGEYITVATTRPETMLGDTAVAINPKDPRAPQFAGKKVRLPIVDRIIPIIEDDYVVRPAEYGGDENDPKAKIATGFLKVTPAHDPNDEQIWMRHREKISHGQVNIFAPDATISDKHGWTDISEEARQFVGLSREDARKKVVQWFKDHGLLEEIKPYTHSVGHSYRSHVPIEPYLSDQWYVKVTDDRMRGEALRAMAREQYEGDSSAREAASGPGDGELRFYPARYAKTFQSWHENLRDWCISRQLWWGHRIPVWSTRSSKEGIAQTLESIRVIWPTVEGSYLSTQVQETEVADQSELTICLLHPNYCPEFVKILEDEFEFVQDPDVLDTWFSSGLWPLSTMGWPVPEDFPDEIPEGSALIEKFNPSSVLCTAREIITLWVSRMVMFNRYFRDGTLPFRDVYIHAMIQDGHGQKMSKSLGNGVDPRDIIHTHGADAMRFILTQIATATQDVRLPVDMICPHPGCGHTFHPKEITIPGAGGTGYRVAAAEQSCPNCKKKMISGYGAASGIARVTAEAPLARNSSTRFDQGRNFANKIWNATRFALSNLDASRRVPAAGSHDSSDESSSRTTRLADLSLVDKWIIARLHRTLHAVEDSLKEYQFNAYADAMYDLVWRDFCDWYLEAIKPTVKSNPAQQQALRTVLNAIMRLLHPIMPFVTEALWPSVSAPGIGGFAGLEGIKLPPSELLATAAWPDIKCSVDDQDAVSQFQRVQSLVDAIRSLKTERQAQKKRVRLYAARDVIELIQSAGGVVESLAGLESVEPIEKRPQGPGAIPLAFEGHELLLAGLVDAVDVGTEKSRLAKLISEKERAISGFRGKLNNEGYISKAPPDKVTETRTLLAQAQADLAAATKALESLG